MNALLAVLEFTDFAVIAVIVIVFAGTASLATRQRLNLRRLERTLMHCSSITASSCLPIYPQRFSAWRAIQSRRSPPSSCTESRPGFRWPKPKRPSKGLAVFSATRRDSFFMKCFIFSLAVALALAACNKPASVKRDSVLSTIVNGRTINATIAGPSFIHPEADGAVITTDSHKIVIERQRVTIDGTEIVKLPVETKNVQLWLNGEGYFTMNADGMGVAAKQLSK
jgi:hypothetical protein